MPKRRPWRCRDCGGWSHEVGQISWTGLCAHCGATRARRGQAEIASRSGPAYDAWLAGSRAAAERVREQLPPAGN